MSDFRVMGITVLTGLDAVRKRPGLYVGELDREGLPVELMAQGLCHALDEAASGRCTRVMVALSGSAACIQYNASPSLEEDERGSTQAERLFSVLHACSNEKENLEVGDEYCTLGLAVLNAFSKVFLATVIHDGRKKSFFYQEGVLIESKSEECRGTNATTLSFSLDETLLGDNTMIGLADGAVYLDKVRADFPKLRIEGTQ